MLWARMVAYVTGTVNQELPNWGWAIVVLTLVINKQLSGGATLRENTAGCTSKFARNQDGNPSPTIVAWSLVAFMATIGRKLMSKKATEHPGSISRR
jgi:hypothetical protein